MAGTNIEQYEGRGINYRALDDLFALNAKRQGEVSEPQQYIPQALDTSIQCNAEVPTRLSDENASL